MRSYSSAIGELHIISRATQRTQVQDGNLYLHGFRPWPTFLGRMLFFYTLLRRAREIVKVYDVEVVSAQDPFEHGWVAMRAVAGTSAKLHIQLHTDFLSPFFASESFKNSMRLRIANRVLPKADGIRTVSVRAKRALMKRYGTSILEPSVIPVALQAKHTLPNVVSNQSLQKYPFTFALITIGRLEKEKRIKDAILVVARLVQNRYPVGLLVVGSGSQRKSLAHFANTLGIKNRIIFLGERTDVSELLKNSSQAFIQTSAYEGYGLTYVEAALACTPMVVTDVGIINDVFINNKSALVCPVGDIGCLSNKVANLIEDMSLRHTLADVAKEVAQKHINSFGDLSRRIADDLRKTITSSHKL